MCGIAGLFDYRGHGKIDRALLRAMTDILGHRGPDGEGFHFAPGLGLGHRRLDRRTLAHRRPPYDPGTPSIDVTAGSISRRESFNPG